MTSKKDDYTGGGGDLVEIDEIGIAEIPCLDNVLGIAIYDNYVFTLGYDGDCLISIDVTDPANMSFVSSETHTYLDGCACIVLSDNGASAYLVAPGLNAISSYNISNRSNMIYRDHIVNTTLLNQVDEVVISGNTVFTKSWNSSNTNAYICSVNVINPNSINILDSYNIKTSYGVCEHITVDIDNDILYASMYAPNTIVAFDVSDPSNMNVIGTYAPPSLVSVNALVVSNNVLYVSEYGSDSSIASIDVSVPSNMVELSVIRDIDEGIQVLRIYGDVLYCGDANLTSINISNPSNMSVIDKETTPVGNLKDMVISGDGLVLYTANGNSDSVSSIDIS